MRKQELYERRKRRVRHRLKKLRAVASLRLTVFRSNKNIYAQIVNDSTGCTIVSASTVDKTIGDDFPKAWSKLAAEKIGHLVAERALQQGIKKVFFDRGGYLFHGRVKSLADGARECGLEL